jgi:diadenosine tetraphosphatase ApaH/serine/threonine PP2A family protein phosphatase
MDIDQFIANVLAHQPIDEFELAALFSLAAEIFYQEGNIISLSAPITVCGDVHGQFYDVLELFQIGGPPSEKRYLFLGDYVDRGHYSVDTVALLLAYKVRYPTTFFLLRGNHECRQVNHMYGFYEEVLSRFGHPGPYNLINELFDNLPMAALIGTKIFCVHGGLSPEIRSLVQIPSFDRVKEIPSGGPVSDLVWSDPEAGLPNDGWGHSQRGAGFLFGPKPANEFCHNNALLFIARAHQMAADGYQWHFPPDRKVVTVWSAPNYMYRSGNRASVMIVPDTLEPEFRQFDAVPDDKRVIPTGALSPYFS